MSRKSIAEVGKRIKAIRHELQINQTQFADSIGSSSCYLSEIENGKGKNPGFNFFYNMSRVHNINLNFLFHGIGDMFVSKEENTESKSVDERETIDEIVTLDDLFWILNQIPFFRDNVMGYAGKYFFDNQAIILKRLKANKIPKKIKEEKMFREKSTTVLKMFLALMFCIVLSISSFARLGGNGSGSGYTDPETGTETDLQSSIIETYVEQGAGYYFDSYSEYMSFSKSFELQDQKGTDYDEWKEKIDRALSNIKRAKDTYSILIKEAEVTPYNWRVIYRLWFFDYYEFRRRKGLNSVIFRDVENYLAIGDITGVYRKIYNDMTNIEVSLIKLKDDIDEKKEPLLEELWDLTDSYSYMITFSQYVSRVFFEL